MGVGLLDCDSHGGFHPYPVAYSALGVAGDVAVVIIGIDKLEASAYFANKLLAHLGQHALGGVGVGIIVVAAIVLLLA